MRRIDLACCLTETVAELVSSRFAFKATGPAPQLQLLFSRSPGTLSPMAAVLNAQLTAMLTALDGAAAGLGNEFVAHVGSTMAMAAAMPTDWFPKTGTPTAAQIASFLMRLHDLKTIVWANYPTAGVTCMADWIVPTGSNLTEAIRPARPPPTVSPSWVARNARPAPPLPPTCGLAAAAPA